jgi:hypothetical protein
MRFFAAAALVVLLTGCAQTPRVVQGPFDSFNSAQRLANDCAQRVNGSEVGQKVSTQILALTDNSVARVGLMSSKSVASEEQIRLLLTYLSLNEECRKALKNFQSLTSLHNAVAALHGDFDVSYAKLIAKESTIGDVNRDRIAALDRFNRTLAEITSGVQQQMNQAAAEQEAARRAFATQYLLNQMRRPAYQVPVPQNTYKPPVQTNCTRIGDTLNCTSR